MGEKESLMNLSAKKASDSPEDDRVPISMVLTIAASNPPPMGYKEKEKEEKKEGDEGDEKKADEGDEKKDEKEGDEGDEKKEDEEKKEGDEGDEKKADEGDEKKDEEKKEGDEGDEKKEGDEGDEKKDPNKEDEIVGEVYAKVSELLAEKLSMPMTLNGAAVMNGNEKESLMNLSAKKASDSPEDDRVPISMVLTIAASNPPPM